MKLTEEQEAALATIREHGGIANVQPQTRVVPRNWRTTQRTLQGEYVFSGSVELDCAAMDGLQSMGLLGHWGDQRYWEINEMALANMRRFSLFDIAGRQPADTWESSLQACGFIPEGQTYTGRNARRVMRQGGGEDAYVFELIPRAGGMLPGFKFELRAGSGATRITGEVHTPPELVQLVTLLERGLPVDERRPKGD